MSWLKLRSLLRPRKAWKLFTNKLQVKLSKSKAVKKLPKTKPHEKYRWPHLSIRPKKFKLKSKSHTRIHKRPPSVYVDHLFIQPVPVVTKTLDPPPFANFLPGEGEASEEKSRLKYRCDHPEVHQLESDEGDASLGDGRSSDEMWESLVMNSPQMHGINERAEEFIARFRAQMHQQERLARRL